MRVVHAFGGKVAAGSADNPGFLFTSRHGGYCWLSAAGQVSRYAGGFFPHSSDKGFELWKAIERLDFDVPFSELTNRFAEAELRNEASSVRILYFEDGLHVTTENTGFRLVLDCRRFYDFDDRGRIYSVEKEGGSTIIHYKKYADQKLLAVEYEVFVAVFGAVGDELSLWTEKYYPYDDARHDLPASRYVYEALGFGPGRVAICYGSDRHEVVRKAQFLYENHEEILAQRLKQDAMLPSSLAIKDDATMLAYEACLHQLDGLYVSVQGKLGIIAGLPYFPQFWARDEAISIGALLSERRDEEAHGLLLKNLALIKDDGRLANFSGETNLSSADGLGWVCLRLLSYYHHLRKRQPIPMFELEGAGSRLKEATAALLKGHEVDGLVSNGPLETWMDTAAGGDVRDGLRIEVQALFLVQVRLIAYILNELASPEAPGWIAWEHEVAQKVRQRFFDGILKDGADDPTVRPNVFLAYYLAPNLLHQKEWEAVFDKCIEQLWTGFGFATIDRQNPLFCPDYTGGDNRSYHRGDSWFWVNNLAALCLARLNRRRYRNQVEAILAASRQEILFMGIVGHHAELSSASTLRSEGCLSQAWSAALFIEMVHEVYSKE